MPVTSVGSVAQAIEDGSFWEAVLNRTSSPFLNAGRIGDLSVGTGVPKYNAYVGDQMNLTPLYGTANNGIYTGENAPGKNKYLTKLTIYDVTASRYPGVFWLCDYLAFYPLMDGDSIDFQPTTNTDSVVVPRMPANGAQLMMVCSVQNGSTTNCTITISYTNQSGVAGRTTTCKGYTFSVVGEIVSYQPDGIGLGQLSPFIRLQAGDTGVTSVQSVTLSDVMGGFVTIVLVKPIATFGYNEAGTATEYEMFQHKGMFFPIADGAYLNFLVSFTGGVSGTIAPKMFLTFARV